jgi:hypothetical protein
VVLRDANLASKARRSGGTVGVDEELVARGFDNVGAWIHGRNMIFRIGGGRSDHPAVPLALSPDSAGP